jgi:nucleotide-binding universal stress UspA family protein
MMMKSLMLHVAHDEELDGRMQVALDIARRFESHLTLVQPSMVQDFVAFDMAGGSHFIGQAYDAAEEARVKLKARIEADLGNEGVNWDWQIMDSSSRVAVLAEVARLCDLSILSLDKDRRGSAQPGRTLAGDLVMNSRTPVLAIPPGIGSFSFGTAMIAYDGGPEASYAIRCAAPLLAQCDDVVLVEIDTDDEALPLTDAADYLARSGAKVRIEAATNAGRTIEEQLLASADTHSADFMVMGAYGHRRWREALFGGVTHYLLAESKIPLLMAH